jgi:hypothetical protein
VRSIDFAQEKGSRVHFSHDHGRIELGVVPDVLENDDLAIRKLSRSPYQLFGGGRPRLRPVFATSHQWFAVDPGNDITCSEAGFFSGTARSYSLDHSSRLSAGPVTTRAALQEDPNSGSSEIVHQVASERELAVRCVKSADFLHSLSQLLVRDSEMVLILSTVRGVNPYGRCSDQCQREQKLQHPDHL